ncbi:hypothetical protein ABID56_001454 [Alkalibacillus flavidus]|uniref:Spore coat protein CotO n=1 Tax=Alkalibacillus flavidus TaxID=546021 RepID=A0ABV2KUW4_9BACI
MPEKQAKPPLLFISNPPAIDPVVQAQSQYYSSEEKSLAPAEDEAHESPNKRRKFHDMTIDEKLRYMVDMPDVMPKMKCEVKTDQQTYIGTVEQCDDNQLVIRTADQGFRVKMKRDQVEDVRLVGF